MKIGIEGQRLFEKKKHGMDMVALELKNLQDLDHETDTSFCKMMKTILCLKRPQF
jgi:hypothetical protein